jgi:Ulp1 family protease
MDEVNRLMSYKSLNAKWIQFPLISKQATKATKSDGIHDVGSWILSHRNVPQQNNCNDCGVIAALTIIAAFHWHFSCVVFMQVFTCMFAHYLALGLDLRFSAVNMPMFREKITLSILNESLC